MKTEETTALAERVETSTEISATSQQAEVQQRIQGAIILARKFPRNEAEGFQRLMTSCQRPSFASRVSYQFPRGGKKITGPSVHVAREAKRVWGNIHSGLNVIHDDDENRTIRAWAWDLEHNTYKEAESTFAKKIFRKKNGWVVPDERDLRELTNKHGSILERNCILEILPKDLIEDAELMARTILQSNVERDPEAEAKRILVAFSRLRVKVEDLEKYLGHSFDSSTPEELMDLMAIHQSISDGNSKWSEYANGEETIKTTGSISMEDLKPSDDQSPPDRKKEEEKPGLFLSGEEVDDINTLVEDNKYPKRKLTALLKGFGVKKIEDLTKKQGSSVVSSIQSWIADPEK